MYKSVRFNDRELSHYAINCKPDKEGLLEKKGAVRGQGYRLRWFRLKGNLLFYFKVDELQDWESTGDPVGVIVLERFKVEDTHTDGQPFSFALNFEGDISRMYILKAYSKQEQKGWMNAISSASYERLKFQLYKLQEQINSQTGVRQHKAVLSDLPPHLILSPSSSRRLSYQRPSQRVRADWLKTSAQQTQEFATLLLQLECFNLPKDIPSSMIVVLYGSASQSYNVLSSTELIESCCNPSFWHQITLPLSSNFCTPKGVLMLKVVTVHDIDATSSRKDVNHVVANGKERELYSIRCPISRLMDLATDGDKHLDLLLNNDNDKVSSGSTSGAIMRIRVQQVHYYPVENKCTTPSSPASKHKINMYPGVVLRQTSYLPDVTKSSVWSHFVVPVGRDRTVMVAEELSECLFNIIVPLEMLKCLRKEVTIHLDETNYNIGALSESHLESFGIYQTFLFESKGLYTSTIKDLETLADKHGFKPVKFSQDPHLQFVPTNLHIQKLHVISSASEKNTSYGFVTMGSPTYNNNNKRTHGLRSLLAGLPCYPSFVCQRSTASSAGLVTTELTKLAEIKRNFDFFKNALFRGCGNANPRDISSAFTGISTEVQRLLALTQSTVVLEAVGDLIRARPGNPVLSFSSTPISNTTAISIEPGRRNLTLRRKLPTPNRIGCSCGKCAKCIPSPSDWIWNGSHYVQVSTGEWKLEDTTASIQELLVRLLDKVEEASKKVVDQQHEAHAASTDTTNITTFKPTYVWSESLIPTIMELHQTIEGFIKLVHSSLSFSLMKLDSCLPNLFEVKKHVDIVFTQTLCGLVTSFYIILSQNFTDPTFMKQLKEIGFLANFECLLSSTGEELGMLEDMMIGVTELRNVRLQLAAIAGTDIDFDFRILGTRENLIVQFLINRNLLSCLPNDHIRLGQTVKVIPVLFVCGVNESSQAEPLTKLQEGINQESLGVLSEYITHYQSLDDVNAQQKSSKIKEQYDHLKTKYETHKSKNIEVFISAEKLCRSLTGGRVTTCRSGKDRTGMGITLEECVILRTEHKMQDTNFLKALSAFRSAGTQLENCFKNTGSHSYFFNAAQYQMLPRILQPPKYTCRQSFVNTD